MSHLETLRQQTIRRKLKERGILTWKRNMYHTQVINKY